MDSSSVPIVLPSMCTPLTSYDRTLFSDFALVSLHCRMQAKDEEVGERNHRFVF